MFRPEEAWCLPSLLQCCRAADARVPLPPGAPPLSHPLGWQRSSHPFSKRVDFYIPAGSDLLFSRVFTFPGKHCQVCQPLLCAVVLRPVPFHVCTVRLENKTTTVKAQLFLSSRNSNLVSAHHPSLAACLRLLSLSSMLPARLANRAVERKLKVQVKLSWPSAAHPHRLQMKACTV